MALVLDIYSSDHCRRGDMAYNLVDTYQLRKRAQRRKWMKLTYPPTKAPHDMRVTCGWLLTKMSLEILDFYFAARGHYSGAIVQAQEAGVTFS